MWHDACVRNVSSSSSSIPATRSARSVCCMPPLWHILYGDSVKLVNFRSPYLHLIYSDSRPLCCRPCGHWSPTAVVRCCDTSGIISAESFLHCGAGRYRAPRYLADCCLSVYEVSGHRHRTFGTRGLSQSPVRRFGVHCLIRCVIRPSSLNFLGATWKRIFFLPNIRDMSALEVSSFHAVALIIRHLLTYY